MVRRRLARLVFLCAFLPAATLAVPSTASAQSEQVVEIPTRPGVTVRFIAAGPRAGNPPVAILFSGGGGVLRLGSWNGRGNPSSNFLVRTRKDFARRGFLVAVPDAPSDLQASDMSMWRTSKDHAADIAAVIRRLRRYSKGPVFLVGTSRGTISAAGVTANLPPGTIAGIVLASTVTRYNRARNKDRVQTVDLAKIRVPVLLVHHRDDACYVTVYEDLPELAKAFTRAPSVEIKGYSGGGDYRGSVCGARAAHGYRGIEARVVGDIARWMHRVAAHKPLK